MENTVYHSSSKSGLKIIEPNISTHGKKWIYATKDLVMSAVFISGIGGDLTCQIGRDQNSNLPFICERFQGAFDLRYAGKSGSIYQLSARNFIPDKTGWDEEVICNSSVEIMAEILVPDTNIFLLELEKQNKLIIKYHPDRIAGIPADDSDLVKKCAEFCRMEPRFIEMVDKYHPNLVKKVKAEIKINF